ncbi:phosphoesterase family-domain-containing protein [Amanita rubescens]|nr:phosphoesterase family-domain-containing protein [Amanita rubescens]
MPTCLTLAVLSALAALSSVHAQTSTASAFISGSPVILSALPSATSALYNNTNAPSAPKGKVFKYFMQIWLENEDYDTIVQLPQFQAVAEQGILLTNYNAITHPSEPNYIAAVAGSNLGIIDDNYYDIPANETSIFDLLEQKGLTWKGYNEDIPAAGWTGYSNANGTYVRKHNFAIVFDSIGLNQTRSANVVHSSVLQVDIANKNMPAYSVYTPNINNDGHNTNGSYAGTWLDGFLKSTLANASFMNEALVLITFDESENYTIRNQVWSCLIGGAIPARLRNTTDNTFYTHYSALRTVELNWDLGSLNRGDANATLSNVFQFAASALNYTNVNVSNIPFMNNSITGLLTNQSYNATQNGSASGSKPSSGAVNTNVAHLFAAAALSVVAAIVVPFLL